jgi:toxin YoeB
MILSWADNAWDNYLYWQQADKKILKDKLLMVLAIQNL